MNELIVKAGGFLKKHSPEILAGIGVVGTIAGVIFACKATTKAPAVIEDHNERLDEAHKEEDQKERGKKVIKTYMVTGMEFAKLYGPSVTLITLSLGCLLKPIDILKKENAAITSTLVGVNGAFKKYRDNVIDRFGEEVDYELEHGIKRMEITEEETDPETGKKHKVKKNIDIVDPSNEGIYVKYFTRKNDWWDQVSDNGRLNDDYIQMLFNGWISKLNADLHAKRHAMKDKFVLTNDAYALFGFERDTSGLAPCWIYDDEANGGKVLIDYKKVHIKNEDNQFEEAYAITFRPTHNAFTGDRL